MNDTVFQDEVSAQLREDIALARARDELSDRLWSLDEKLRIGHREKLSHGWVAELVQDTDGYSQWTDWVFTHREEA